MILMSILGFLGRPDIVAKPECTVDIALWVQDGRYLFKVKPLIYIIFDRIESDS